MHAIAACLCVSRGQACSAHAARCVSPPAATDRLSAPPTRAPQINGCVSTGKEANVYHASAPGGAELAVKVYKTSILVFKDRDRWALRWAGVREGACARHVQCHLPPPPRAATECIGAHIMRARAQVCGGGLALCALRQGQPAQDGQDVGREGDAQPGAPRRRRRALPAPPAGACLRVGGRVCRGLGAWCAVRSVGGTAQGRAGVG